MDDIVEERFCEAPIIGRGVLFAEDFLRNELIFPRFVHILTPYT